MWNCCALLVGIKNTATAMENSMAIPQKIKNRTTIRSSNITSRYWKYWKQKLQETHSYPCSQQHYSQEPKVRQPRCPLMDTRINELCVYIQWISAVLWLVVQLCPTLWDPMDYSLPGSSVHGDSLGKNTGVGCHVLLQGIFPTQGLNPGLPHCRWILYCLSYQGSLQWNSTQS